VKGKLAKHAVPVGRGASVRRVTARCPLCRRHRLGRDAPSGAGRDHRIGGDELLGYLLRRVLYMVIAFIVISFVTFELMRAAPGSFLQLGNSGLSAVNLGLGSIGVDNPAAVQDFIRTFHLNQPWYMQYWGYVWGFVTLHMGTSFEYQSTPTVQLIEQTFPLTLTIAVFAIVVAVVLSIFLGTIAALRANTWADRSTVLVATLAASIPQYVVAVILMLIFGVWLQALPVVGEDGPKYFILPILAMALPMCGAMSRYMRNSLVETMNSEYMVTVYAKGGGMRQALFGHGLRNSLLPFITVVGPQLAALMMGTVYIEQMFGLLGLGKIFTSAAATKDYPLIMDSTLMYAVFIMVMNLLVDVCYSMLDPRIRRSQTAKG
jgi:ABC-type dipeptide/oligopeptide/nickel transport system permease component